MTKAYLGVLLLITVLLNLQDSQGQGSLVFKQNAGQWPEEVNYAATIPNGTAYFTDQSVIFDICESDGREESIAGVKAIKNKVNCHRFKLNFNPYDQNTVIIPSNPLKTRYNYLVGDRENWGQNIKGFSGILYTDVIPGVDIRFYSQDNDLKYDIIADNKSRLEDLHLGYEGVEIREQYGNLVLNTSIGDLIESLPLAYSTSDSRNIECGYLLENGIIQYEVKGDLSEDEGIVIDPILIFSTFSGSTADNWGSTATFDDAGNLYSGGISTEVRANDSFITTLGAYQRDNAGIWDVAITKYDSAGSQPIYSTLLGGFRSEMVQSLVVNKKGELVVMGITSSINFPVTENAYQTTYGGGITTNPIGVELTNGSDIFVSILSADGSELIGSTFLGGGANDGLMLQGQPLTKNYGDESRGDVYTDENDNIYIASKTPSNDYPIEGGFQSVLGGNLDALVVKLNSDVSGVEWSTFIGGTGYDAAYSIKKNELGQVIVSGGTTSSGLHANFINTYSGDVDGWVAILEDDGSQLVAGRYMGTSLYEQSYFIDLDPFDNVYCFGQSSGNYPVVGNVYNQGDGQFIQKFNADLSLELLSTEFGSINPGPDISPTAFLVNDCGNIYVSGWGGEINNPVFGYIGNSTFGMPVTLDAFQPVTSGSDFYLGVFVDDAANLLYGTFLGGTEAKIHVDGGTSRFDSRGIVYHAVCAGCRAYTSRGGIPNALGWSDFPTTPGAWSNQNNSSNCNNAAFKFDLSSLRAGFRTNTPQLDKPDVGFVCMPDSLVFENMSIGGETFEWDFGDGRRIITTEKDNITHSYLAPGLYRVKLKIIDRSTCAEVDSTYKDVVVYNPQIQLPEDQKICEGESFFMQVTGATQVNWYDPEGILLSSQTSVGGTPSEDLKYYVEANYQQCVLSDTLLVDVVPKGEISITSERDCTSGREVEFYASVEEDVSGQWEFGDGNSSEELEVSHEYAQDGNYLARFTAQRENCEFPFDLPVSAFEISAPSVFTPGLKDNRNDVFKVIGSENISLEVFNRWGSRVYLNEDYRNEWTAEDVETGTYYYLITTLNGSTCKGWVQVVK